MGSEALLGAGGSARSFWHKRHTSSFLCTLRISSLQSTPKRWHLSPAGSFASLHPLEVSVSRAWSGDAIGCLSLWLCWGATQTKCLPTMRVGVCSPPTPVMEKATHSEVTQWKDPKLWPVASLKKKKKRGFEKILIADSPPRPKKQGCFSFSYFLLIQHKFLPG